MFDDILDELEDDLHTECGKFVTELVSRARNRLGRLQAQALAEVATERTKALPELDAKRAELGREVAAMHVHTEAQQGHVKLNIGGYRYETHTFFDA